MATGGKRSIWMRPWQRIGKAGCAMTMAMGLALSLTGCATELAGDLMAPDMPGRPVAVAAANAVETTEGLSIQASSYQPVGAGGRRIELTPCDTTELEGKRVTVALDDRPFQSPFLRFDLTGIPRDATVAEAYLAFEYDTPDSFIGSTFDLLIYDIQSGPLAVAAKYDIRTGKYSWKDFTVTEVKDVTGDIQFWGKMSTTGGAAVRPVDLFLYRVSGTFVSRQYHSLLKEANAFIPVRLTKAETETAFNVEMTSFVEQEIRTDGSLTLCLHTGMAGRIRYDKPRLVIRLAEAPGAPSMTPTAAAPTAPTPQPQTAPGSESAEQIKAKLETLKQMLDEGLISETEYQAKRKELLDRL